MQQKAAHLKNINKVWGGERDKLSVIMKRLNGAQVALKIRETEPAR